jgi:hypothetical protein
MNTRSINYFLALLLLFVSFLQTACNKKNDNEPETPPITGVKRAVGTPDGTATSKTIGAEGGTIALPDNAVSISIPAGALPAATNISIQPITNTNVAAIGRHIA